MSVDAATVLASCPLSHDDTALTDEYRLSALTFA